MLENALDRLMICEWYLRSSGAIRYQNTNTKNMKGQDIDYIYIQSATY
jgi:hypothetical protein